MNVIKELNRLYNEEGLSKTNEKELIEVLQSKETKELVDKIIHDEIQVNDNDLLTFVKCTQYIDEYTDVETQVSDYDYDIIREILESRVDNVPITVPNITKKNVAHHKYISLRGTLDKIYDLSVTKEEDDNKVNKSRKSLYQWIESSQKKIKNTTGKDIDLSQTEVYCFPKFDGLSVEFEFEKNGKFIRSLSRGDTARNEAQDYSKLFKDWVEGPFDNFDYPYGLKTEVMVSEEDLIEWNETYHTNYKNSRSIASSILNSDDVDERIEKLTIVPLRYSYFENVDNESLQGLAPAVFNIYPYLRCRLCDKDLMIDFANNHRYVEMKNGKHLRCDGMVIYIIDKAIQKILGREDEKQKYEVAFKFTEEFEYTTVEDITFTTGLFGRINPCAKIKPIKLKGNKIKSISLGSYGRFKELGLAKGDKVKICYDIIPYLFFNPNLDKNTCRSGNEVINPPKICPCCGKELIESTSGDLIYCKNPECDINKKGKILNYLQKMNIPFISYATVNDFYEEGYLKSIKDLYKLEKHKKELCQIPGYKKKTVNNIIDGINEHRTVQGSILLGSLGIESIGRKKFSTILQSIDFDSLIDACINNQPSKLIGIKGVQEKTAIKIIEGINNSISLLQFLEKELDIEKESTKEVAKFKVYMTKQKDSDVIDFIHSKGGELVDSFTKDVSLLTVPDNSELDDNNEKRSAKVDKAKRWGTPIVLLEDAMDYIDKNF